MNPTASGHDVLLDVDGLRHVYGGSGGELTAIEQIDFQVRAGEFVSIVGPSGAGKTTLLRCLAGLLDPTGGQVRFGSRPIDGVPDDVAMVFQDYSRSLFPWMRVAANVEFPLKRLALSASDRKRRVGESLEAVGLGAAAAKYPWELSGGMQQRVAIARALAYRPGLLLMDEPFASVDAQTRADLEDLVLEVRRAYDMTFVFVTHDIDESVYLSNRVLVLSKQPSRLIADLSVELPEERDQIATKELPEFVGLRARVARLIRGEPNRSPGPRASQAQVTSPAA